MRWAGVESLELVGCSRLCGVQQGLRAALQHQLSAAQIQLIGFKAGVRSYDAGDNWIQVVGEGGLSPWETLREKPASVTGHRGEEGDQISAASRAGEGGRGGARGPDTISPSALGWSQGLFQPWRASGVHEHGVGELGSALCPARSRCHL